MIPIGEVVEEVMTQAALPEAAGGLDIPVILGFPVMGRKKPTFPVCSITFATADEATIPRRRTRIGDSTPAGDQIVLAMGVFANDESELIGLVGRLMTYRKQHRSVTITSGVYQLIHSAVIRGDSPTGDEVDLFHYVTMQVTVQSANVN